jgi:hypothetical protein
MKVTDQTCDVAGCDEPAAVMVPAVTADGLVDQPAGELVPLCARHAEQAQARVSLRGR